MNVAHHRGEFLHAISSRSDAMSAPSALAWAEKLGVAGDWPPRTLLVRGGCVSREAFFVEEGLVKLSSTDVDGNDRILAVRAGSTVIGASFALAGLPCPVSVTTVTRCRVIRILSNTFREAIFRDPRLSFAVNVAQSAELIDLLLHFSSMCQPSASRRVRYVHDYLRSKSADGEAGAAKLPFRDYEIAQMIGVSPEHLSRTLKKMGFAARGGTPSLQNKHTEQDPQPQSEPAAGNTPEMGKHIDDRKTHLMKINATPQFIG
jgi:CRP-like cAMP-binding protein